MTRLLRVQSHSLFRVSCISTQHHTGLIASEVLKAVSANFGANIVLSRAVRVGTSNHALGVYVHNQLSPGIGTMAAAVALRAPDMSLEQVPPLHAPGP